MILYEHLEI